MNKHIYEESRLIQIDTHRPGDLTVERASTVQLENSWKMWTIKHGPRDIFTTAIHPEAPRVLQMKENAQLRDAQTAITTKNAKINDLEKKLALLQTQLKAKATAPPSTSNKRDLRAVQEEETISPTFKKRVIMTETSRNDNSGFPPVHANTVEYITRPTAHHANPVLVEMSQELKKTELDKSISQNRIRILELQLLAAQKQTALLDAKNEQTVAKARHNLELNGIHIDQREMQQAARNRMNAIHDEDRTWQKESARRQWLVEDRQVSASRILDLASKAHELPTLQTLLSAQHANTAQAAMHPFMRPLPNSVAGMQSLHQQQQFVQQQQGSMPYSLPPQPASAVAAAAVAAAAEATSSSSTTPMQWTPTAIPVSNGQTTLEEQEEAELSAKVLELERQLAEEYGRLGNQ